MIKQDVGINATSLTGDIAGARAALLFSSLLFSSLLFSSLLDDSFTISRRVILNESVLSKCVMRYREINSSNALSPCNRNHRSNAVGNANFMNLLILCSTRLFLTQIFNEN